MAILDTRTVQTACRIILVPSTAAQAVREDTDGTVEGMEVGAVMLLLAPVYVAVTVATAARRWGTGDEGAMVPPECTVVERWPQAVMAEKAVMAAVHLDPGLAARVVPVAMVVTDVPGELAAKADAAAEQTVQPKRLREEKAAQAELDAVIFPIVAMAVKAVKVAKARRLQALLLGEPVGGAETEAASPAPQAREAQVVTVAAEAQAVPEAAEVIAARMAPE